MKVLETAARKVLQFHGIGHDVAGGRSALAASSTPEPVKRTALIVSRDRAARKWGPRWLEQAGFTTVVVSSAAEALDAIRAEAPSVVIVEAALRTRDGARLFEVVRERSDADVPVLVLCASSAEVQSALDAEVTDLVRKPLDWHLVSRRVAHLAERLELEQALDNARNSLEKALAYADDARRYVARRDSVDLLTGLPNRTKFRELVERALSGPADICGEPTVLVIGLDRFHLINEALGRETANELLAEIGARLRACLQSRDLASGPTPCLMTAAAAALGGVRYGMFLTQTDGDEGIFRFRDAVLEALSRPFDMAGQRIYVSPSIGAATGHKDADTADALLLHAETAMLDAKKRGGGFRFFQRQRDRMSARKLELHSMLRQALDREELQLQYQPLVGVRNGRLLGAEALLRWQHPEHGAISPGEFIPVAEETGLMVEVGAFVIETACRQMRVWLDAGLPRLRMAVNISTCQLRRGDLVEIVAAAIREHGIDPGDLELELSERGVVGGDAEILHQLHALKALGVRLSVDDFGTGDSAIAYLKKLPIDVLKIDRSYVSGALNDRKDAAIASAMVALAQRLELTVIAEGVETPEQLGMLRDWGCDECQGFHFSPAVPSDDFIRFFEAEAAAE